MPITFTNTIYDKIIENLSTIINDENSFKQVSNIMERLKRLVFNNINYSSGTSWFDGRITDIEYSRDEDDETLLNGVATFVCNNIEII